MLPQPPVCVGASFTVFGSEQKHCMSSPSVLAIVGSGGGCGGGGGAGAGAGAKMED